MREEKNSEKKEQSEETFDIQSTNVKIQKEEENPGIGYEIGFGLGGNT